MDGLSLSEVMRLVDAANAVRQQRDASGGEVGPEGLHAERRLEAIFDVSHTWLYTARSPRAGGDAVSVSVLTAPSLATAWPDLDHFEGPGYWRILVPVFGAGPGPERTDGRRLYTVANLYAAAEAGPDATARS